MIRTLRRRGLTIGLRLFVTVVLLLTVISMAVAVTR